MFEIVVGIAGIVMTIISIIVTVISIIQSSTKKTNDKHQKATAQPRNELLF